MTGNLKLHPLEVLLRMCPLAAVQSLLAAFLSGELQYLFSISSTITRHSTALVFFNGMLAFAQNFSSFHTNKIAGALTLTMCANLKQAVTVMVAINVFETRVGYLFIIGMIVVLLAAGTYSWTLMGDREKQAQPVVQPTHMRNLSAAENGLRALSEKENAKELA